MGKFHATLLNYGIPAPFSFKKNLINNSCYVSKNSSVEPKASIVRELNLKD
jgi:hypothetical protein